VTSSPKAPEGALEIVLKFYEGSQAEIASKPGHPLDCDDCAHARHTSHAARAELAALRSTVAALRGERERLRAIVDVQAEDPGLWFIDGTAPEAYLQQELRKLHSAIEGVALQRAEEARKEDS